MEKFQIKSISVEISYFYYLFLNLHDNIYVMSKLYLIGNGFDLHHGIQSSYHNFRTFLVDNKGEYFVNYLEMIFPTTNSSFAELLLWRDFENAIGMPNPKAIYEDGINRRTIYKQPYCNKESYILARFNGVLIELREAFTDWVLSINTDVSPKTIPYYEKGAFFITFNYTETLEKLYGIQEEKIWHIHGSRLNNEVIKNKSIPISSFMNNTNDKYLVFGHGREKIIDINELINDYDKKCPNGYDPDACSEYENACVEICQNIRNQLRKYPKEILENGNTNYSKWRHTLSPISALKCYRPPYECIVLGCSLSDVDFPYFYEINRFCDIWKFSYHLPSDKEHIDYFANNLRIDKKNYSEFYF